MGGSRGIDPGHRAVVWATPKKRSLKSEEEPRRMYETGAPILLEVNRLTKLNHLEDGSYVVSQLYDGREGPIWLETQPEEGEEGHRFRWILEPVLLGENLPEIKLEAAEIIDPQELRLLKVEHLVVGQFAQGDWSSEGFIAKVQWSQMLQDHVDQAVGKLEHESPAHDSWDKFSFGEFQPMNTSPCRVGRESSMARREKPAWRIPEDMSARERPRCSLSAETAEGRSREPSPGRSEGKYGPVSKRTTEEVFHGRTL